MPLLGALERNTPIGGYFSYSSLVLYGIRAPIIGHFPAWKPPLVGGFGFDELVLFGLRELAPAIPPSTSSWTTLKKSHRSRNLPLKRQPSVSGREVLTPLLCPLIPIKSGLGFRLWLTTLTSRVCHNYDKLPLGVTRPPVTSYSQCYHLHQTSSSTIQSHSIYVIWKKHFKPSKHTLALCNF